MENYLYGRPENTGSYDALMSILSAHESLKSYQTSSLPLAQFWYPDKGLDRRVSALFEGLPVDWSSACKCFAYATSLPDGDFGQGKASMTDLMVLDRGKFRIAVEAKYTEYKRRKYDESIAEWQRQNPKNRKKVLHGWKQYLNGRVGDIPGDTPYQLVHRIASACACVGDEKPVVVYHLFWDEALKNRVDIFAKDIIKWVTNMGLHGVDFRIAKTMVVPTANIRSASKESLSDIFLNMGKRPYGRMNVTEIVWHLG